MEYGLFKKICTCFEVRSDKNDTQKSAEKSYNALTDEERKKIDSAADEAAAFLWAHDDRFGKVKKISMQSETEGRKGDVRGLLCQFGKEKIGISAKHRHEAVKHARLARSLDFGQSWYEKPCYPSYWEAVNPIFNMLEAEKKKGTKWGALPNKHEKVYQPILDAFRVEVLKHADVNKMFRYLLGKHDFYKVIKNNEQVILQSFNLYGTLKWGSKVRLPSKIHYFEYKKGNSKTTLEMHTDNGWSLTFRIHNAESSIIPSLKFDINIVGCPKNMSRN